MWSAFRQTEGVLRAAARGGARSSACWCLALVPLLQGPGSATLAAPARAALRAYVAAREGGDADAEAEAGARIETLAGEAGASAWSALLERALAWSEEDLRRYRSCAARIAAPLDEARPWSDAELARLRAEAEACGADALLLSELGNLGHRLGELGHDEQALDWVAWVGERAQLYDDLALLDWSLDWRAQNLWQRGDLSGASALLARAAEVAERRGSAAERTRHQADVSRIEAIRGNLDMALEWAARAEATARASGSSASLRLAAEARGSLLFELGRHAEALALCLELAPAGARDVPRDEGQVRLDILASNALADIGRLESAVFFARRAHEAARTSAVLALAPLLHLEAELGLGLLLGDLGQQDEGLALLDAAAAEFERLDDLRGRAWAAKNRGFVLFGLRRFAEAEAAFGFAEESARALAVPYLEGLAALGLAEALVFGAPDPARVDEERVERALGVATERGEALAEDQILWRVAALRGHLLLARGQPDAARAELERAVEGIERWRRRLAAPGLVEHALRQRADPYRDAALAAAALGRTEDALRFALLLQGRLLSELRARRDAAGVPDAAPELDVLRARSGRLEFEVRRAAENHLRGPREELERAKTELDHALLASELAARDGRGEPGPPPTLGALRGALQSQDLDAALAYLVAERSTLVLLLDARGERHDVLRVLGVGREPLARLVSRLRDPIARLEAGELDLASLDFDVEAARELHDLLVRPLGLAPRARLALVTDEVLSALPFEWLVSGGALAPLDPAQLFAPLAGLEFLGDEHACAYYGSLADLERPRAPLGKGGVTVFLAPESPGLRNGRREVEGIQRAARGRTVRVVADARASDLAALEPGAAVLHFIAHGLVDAEKPAHGGLLLAARDDGAGPARFEAWEIERLDLRGALAVLSACHSGRGSWYSGAGLAGLTRGFLLGGAREVVASQWAVEDQATARFMEAFYGALEREPSVPEALRLARLELRHATDPRGLALAHPYFWAAWIVQR